MLYPKTIEDDISLSHLAINDDEEKFLKDHKDILDSMVEKFKTKLSAYKMFIVDHDYFNNIDSIFKKIKMSIFTGLIISLSLFFIGIVSIDNFDAFKSFGMIDVVLVTVLALMICTPLCFLVLFFFKKPMHASVKKSPDEDGVPGFDNSYAGWKASLTTKAQNKIYFMRGCTENAIREYILYRLKEIDDPGINVKVDPCYDEDDSDRLLYIDVTLSVNK